MRERSAIRPRVVLQTDASISRGWWVVSRSTLALVVGNGPIIQFTFGTLVQPISAEFGWPRSVLASAIVISHVTGALRRQSGSLSAEISPR